MVRNIIYTIIFAVFVTVSWQVGSILAEKRSIKFLLEEHANSVKKFDYYDGMIKEKLEQDLKHKGLPTKFTLEELKKGRRGKVRISYQYHNAASVFGYTYYEMDETITAETKQ